MTGYWLAAVIVGAMIIAAMAGYAGILLYRLYRQHQEQRQAQQRLQSWLAQRSDNILKSIHILANAMLQDELVLSEGAIRICELLKALPGDVLAWQQRYPGMFALYHDTREHPRGEMRSQLAKQERMRWDLQRMRREAELSDQVLADAKLLRSVELQQLIH